MAMFKAKFRGGGSRFGAWSIGKAPGGVEKSDEFLGELLRP